ncbi:glycogen/starch/alpha-glucan phosphorylase, partial [Campylobacter coli]|nr:glycogen/starch/alpha-glucan phosphorylase [Campylobacter coli]
MKKTVFADLHRLFPERINNKTNGITPRRWLLECNPDLTALIAEAIGGDFRDDAQKLTALAPFADDMTFRERFAAVKRSNKV